MVLKVEFLVSLRSREIGLLFMDMKMSASRQAMWVIKGCNLLNANIIFPQDQFQAELVQRRAQISLLPDACHWRQAAFSSLDCLPARQWPVKSFRYPQAPRECQPVLPASPAHCP